LTVYLVGAGPGDPDLLTVRAHRVLSVADVVVVDRLVDDRVVALARPHARIIDVGKTAYAGAAATSQEAITAMLVVLGSQGLTVVRLKGGDPFVFGRGGEELAALRDAGVPAEVVPGVTSALGVPALAGVPVTLRGVASSFLVMSGHDPDEVLAACAGHAGTSTTLVLLMAVATRRRIAEGLLAAGWEPKTSVALISRGATPQERRALTDLGHLGGALVDAPAVIVIGAVASLLEQRGAVASIPSLPTVRVDIAS
jgi:uroporphyrin-III C-methyltransferase